MYADQYSLKKGNLLNHLAHAYMYLMGETTCFSKLFCFSIEYLEYYWETVYFTTPVAQGDV